MLLLCSSALPAFFKEELKRKEATEGEAVTLRCELSKASPVEWKKGHRVLKPSDKYKMRQKDTMAELVIHQVDDSDAGDYTCVCGDQQTTAALAVHGNGNLRTELFLFRFLPWISRSALVSFVIDGCFLFSLYCTLQTW